MATQVATQIVDCDSHFLPRVEPESLRTLLPEGLTPAQQDMYVRDVARFMDPKSFRPGAERTDGRGSDPHRDPETRINAMRDELGVDLQVLIPNGIFGHPYGGSPSGGDRPLPIRIALSKAYNNAAAAAQRQYPDRFIGTAIVPFDDLEESRKEVKRAVKELGLRALMLPGNWLGKNYDTMELFPFCETVNELDIAVFVHQITQGCSGGPAVVDHPPRYPMVGYERMRRLHIGTYLGFGLEYAMACAALTLGGVLDEFPNLRFCFFEAGAGWLSYAMLGCDRSFLIEPACSRTKTRPSELMKKHCFTAVESMENIPALVQMMGGSENMFFGTDYPHPEYQWLPNMVKGIVAHEGLSERDRENILGRNMLRALKRA